MESTPGRGMAGLAARLLALLLLAGCAQEMTAAQVELFQPPIVATAAPARPLRGSFSLENNTTRVGLAPMRPLVPAYAGPGRLLASWNPHPAGVAGRPVFIVMHGGHGLVPGNFATALWLRGDLGASVLVLDSFWSRGIEENWLERTRHGVNMRVLDAIAAARWLRDAQGTDPRGTFVIGDSQGGWTALRLFTDEPFLEDARAGLFRGGIALYPVCRSSGTAFSPRLGPYSGPVIVFTGGRDTATPPDQCPRETFARAAAWTHYPDQTHGWDTANRGAHSPAVDGECGRAMNIYNQFAVCRSDATTADMRRRIAEFVAARRAGQ